MGHDGTLEKVLAVADKRDDIPVSPESFPPWYVEFRKAILNTFKEGGSPGGLTVKDVVSQCSDEHRKLASQTLSSGSDSNIEVVLISLITATLRIMERRGEIEFDSVREKWIQRNHKQYI